MRTSGPGSNPPRPCRAARTRGFTLLELLIVITLIAVASGVAVLALRDPTEGRLEQEATRLASLFEAARAQARAVGAPVRWVPGTGNRDDAPAADFSFVGLPEDSTTLPGHGLARGVVLGPEPVIGAQRVVLRLEDKRLVIATDGLGPFTLVPEEPPAAAGG